MRHRNVRIRQWNRYIERLPKESRTPPGYIRQSHRAARFGVELLDGGPVQPAIDAALAEAARTGERPRRFPVRFIVIDQGKRH